MTETTEKPQSFVFYKSFSTAINDCPDSVQLLLYRAICDFVFEGIEPNFINEPFGRIVWQLVKPQLQANIKRWENGKKGGAPYGNKNGQKQPQPQAQQPYAAIKELGQVKFNLDLPDN